jgi:hypothetical protein
MQFRPELFLDGFCLTDKRGKWYKATFCDTSTQPTYRTYGIDKLTLTQRAMCNDDGGSR